MPFPSSSKSQPFPKHPFKWEGKHTCTNRHKNTRIPISSSTLHGKEKSKRRRGAQGGGVTFHHRLANFVKSGLYLTEVPCFLTSSHLQKSCLCPLLPQNPNDIEKILHCSICQCIGVYPVSCPTDKQMYILMCPGM